MEDMRVARQWAKRAPDERYVSLTEMLAAAEKRKKESRARIVPVKNIRFEVTEDDNIVTFVKGEQSGGKFIAARRSNLTNWSFSQICDRIRCPANYITRLPSKLAVANLTECIAQAKQDKLQLLTHDGEESTLRACTSEKYGRIWDADILQHMIAEYGAGVTGRYRVPGEFGKQKEVTKENTTLFMSDRNMFVFLADEENRVEIPNRRDGQSGSLARGFYFWNSEVGKETIGVSTFYFDYACSNRIIWGQDEVEEVRFRHSKFAPERFMHEVLPQLTKFSEGRTVGIRTAIEAARQVRFESPDEVTELLEKSLSRKDAGRIHLVHLLEEDREIETMWDVVVGMTAFAKSIPFQDQRIMVETTAGNILKSFAA